MKLAIPTTSLHNAGLLCVTALASLTLVTSPGRAQDDHKKWLACQQNSDCIVIPASVCEGQISINKKYYSDYEDYDASFTGFGECKQSPPNDPNAMGACINNACALKDK
jgi:hypothetical protein